MEDSSEGPPLSPPATNNCFPGTPCPHTWPSLPAAAPGTLTKPPPCHSVGLIPKGVCHSSRVGGRAGRNACNQAEASDGCAEEAARGNVHTLGRLWVCFCWNERFGCSEDRHLSEILSASLGNVVSIPCQSKLLWVFTDRHNMMKSMV